MNGWAAGLNGDFGVSGTLLMILMVGDGLVLSSS